MRKRHPLVLKPVLKDYLWGGTKLKMEFGMTSDLEKIAESWVLSCQKDGESVIQNGTYAGKTLRQFVKENKTALGTKTMEEETAPVLIKLIDAKDNLSIQNTDLQNNIPLQTYLSNGN